MSRLLRSIALAGLFLIAPAWVYGFARAEDHPVMPKFEYVGQPLVLPDSDTSSLGTEVTPKESSFMLRCTDAATFNTTAKRLKAKGMIVGIDALDKTLVMVFKYEDGSINFVRSDKQGKKLCIFGTVLEPDIDLGVVLGATDKNKF